ncbi:hypothetical protein [Eubacterium aggregans]|uniref:hypothetical protein n=1 Tax=Eubacterium aggregans TaxID=81409 RepID=UPI003F302FC7
MIVLASTNVIMTISLFSKKRWQCILLGIAIWIFAIIINLIPIKGISGFFLPVDGTSNVAQYLLSLTGDIPAYKNLFLTIPLKVQLFLCYFFGMIIPVILGSILAPRCIQRNSL